MNKARLEWHRKRQADTAEYIRNKNAAAMVEWKSDNQGIDRNDPRQLEELASGKQERAVSLMNAALVLEGERREGALRRAGRFLREHQALTTRAARLRAGEKPLDEWAVCRCGAAFQPGERGYTLCWGCSSKDWYSSSYSCIFCDRRHSMSYPLCFVCKQERTEDGKALHTEDDARFLRLMIMRRDHYTCQMCGADGASVVEEDEDGNSVGTELQVDKIIPAALGGTADPWNMQTLCSGCQKLKGRNCEKLDEREYWTLVHAYWTYLYDYLMPDEKARLAEVEPDWVSEQIDFGHRPTWRTDDECDEREGLLNVISTLGAVVLR